MNVRGATHSRNTEKNILATLKEKVGHAGDVIRLKHGFIYSKKLKHKEALMDNLLHVRLGAVNQDLKFDREYKIVLGRDLFQEWYVVITFGRYGLWGTSRTRTFSVREEAYGFINAKLRRRLSSPKRIGCSYQIVSFDGAEESLEAMGNKVIDRFSWFGNLEAG